MRLHETLAAARATLVGAGIPADSAAFDVELYARTILGWDRARLLCERSGDTPGALEPHLSKWVERRSRWEPSAYIVGRREFWGLEFRVTPAVLIPRPETELIVELALPNLTGLSQARVADIGTGSGCIAVAIAHSAATTRVVATDISSEALAVAADNARVLGVADRIAFVRTSFLDGVAGRFDLIVANPPYIRSTERDSLAADVLQEPAAALFGGADGLRDLRGVIDAAASVLTPGGRLIVEFGAGQEPHVRALVDRHRGRLRVEAVRADLQGHPRTALVRSLGDTHD